MKQKLAGRQPPSARPREGPRADADHDEATQRALKRGETRGCT